SDEATRATFFEISRYQRNVTAWLPPGDQRFELDQIFPPVRRVILDLDSAPGRRDTYQLRHLLLDPGSERRSRRARADDVLGGDENRSQRGRQWISQQRAKQERGASSLSIEHAADLRERFGAGELVVAKEQSAQVRPEDLLFDAEDLDGCCRLAGGQ